MSFPGRSLQRAWHIVDASSQTVGRLATSVAPLLKGKHKPTYRPNADCGDYVVIINAEKVRWTRFVDWMDGLSGIWHLASAGMARLFCFVFVTFYFFSFSPPTF